MTLLQDYIGQLRTYADPPYIQRLKDVGCTAFSIRKLGKLGKLGEMRENRPFLKMSSTRC
jgi:hypothetical protein